MVKGRERTESINPDLQKGSPLLAVVFPIHLSRLLLELLPAKFEGNRKTRLRIYSWEMPAMMFYKK